MKISKIISAFFITQILCLSVFAQTPCTKEAAYQTVGKWGKQKVDDLAMADRSFPKTQYPLVLAKANKVIELFKQAHPEFKGIEGTAKRVIRGDSYVSGGALPFGIDISYPSFFCVGKENASVEMRGKIILFSNYGFTVVYFNSLRNVLESVQDGKPFLTNDGEEIFQFNKQLADFKGLTKIQPTTRDGENHEAIIITPDRKLPYKPVTREKFVQAKIKFYQSQNQGSLFSKDIAALNSMLGSMSTAERQSAAIVRDITASPNRLFVAETEGGRHLVTIDKSFFNPKIPRETIQFITVHWSWNELDIPKVEAIRQFKEKFDFTALKEMLGK